MQELFSHFCGQGRSFEIAGEILPLCQRCLGLYIGVLLTALWLCLSRSWRKGLPATPVIILHSIMLLTAMAGGLHVFDPSPTWRFLCGLWTGHVGLTWLVGATVWLRWESQKKAMTSPWHRIDTIKSLAAIAAVTAIPIGLLKANILGGWFWSGGAAAGLAITFIAITGAVLQLCLRIITSKNIKQSGRSSRIHV
ncbi:MAG: DUF2085 domain-containing protein [Phycisphaerae bacterium]|nr:DUF2085 domain-containing protein [Phycisphaerae bacterium]